MDSGELITLLFWGAVILFSILQSVVQQKRQQEEKTEGTDGFDFPEADEPEGWEARESAAGMIPEEVWEEISGLARGEGKEAQEPEPVEARGGRSSKGVIREGAISYDDAVEEPGPATTREVLADHPIHRSHAEYGTDPSTRRPVRPRPTDPSGPGGPLSGYGRKELKRAVLLHEVLGPPVSRRDKGRGGR